MTIKKKMFYSNTMIVFLSLLVLLAIGGGMLLIFKDDFLSKFAQSSEINDNLSNVKEMMEDPVNQNLSVAEWNHLLSQQNYRLYIEDDNGWQVVNTLKHSEWEAIEHIRENKLVTGQIKTYFMEGATILAVNKEISKKTCIMFAVSSPDNKGFWGFDKGYFEMYILLFFGAGILAIIGILFCSQIVTKYVIRWILQPLDYLNDAAMRIGNGNLEESIAYQEIDEFKPVCDRFDQMQIQLKDSMERQIAYEKARTEMVSGISHDLRTPLTSIKGYIKGMMDGIANTEEKRQHYLKTAYKKSCDMDVLLSKLFYFSKLETGNMPFFSQKTDMVKMLSDYVEEKKIELEEYDGKIIFFEELKEKNSITCCNVDQEQMKRVFDNLVENSMKYAGVEKLLIKIHLKMENNQIKMIFSDNGKGIEQEKLNHVFEQFYRGDESRTSKNDGNGLGLYVCKYIVEKQGGTIEAYCDSGFCVNIQFPICQKGEEV